METVPLYKIVVLGDGNVGKTSLIRQYCEGRFEESRVATIGVDFQTKVVELPIGRIKLSIWDMAGQAHFASVRAGLYGGSRVAALVYDINSPRSMEHLTAWYAELHRTRPDIPIIVVGNKIDLERTTNAEEAQTYAAEINATYMETSAQTASGVDDFFYQLANLGRWRRSLPPAG